MIWVTGWTIGGFFAVRTLVWNLAGKEIISIRNGEINISKKAALFSKPKTYALSDAKNFRVLENANADLTLWGTSRTRNSFSWDTGGTIGFDYGMKTIKFAGGIEEAEGYHILKKLREKKLIS